MHGKHIDDLRGGRTLGVAGFAAIGDPARLLDGPVRRALFAKARASQRVRLEERVELRVVVGVDLESVMEALAVFRTRLSATEIIRHAVVAVVRGEVDDALARDELTVEELHIVGNVNAVD